MVNQHTVNAIKLHLFPVTLKKNALECHTQFPIGHFTNWNVMRTTFVHPFQSKKFEGEIIQGFSHIKQMKDERVEEFFERIMIAASNIETRSR